MHGKIEQIDEKDDVIFLGIIKKGGTVREIFNVASMQLCFHQVWAHHFVVFMVKYMAMPYVSGTNGWVKWV